MSEWGRKKFSPEEDPKIWWGNTDGRTFKIEVKSGLPWWSSGETTLSLQDQGFNSWWGK